MKKFIFFMIFLLLQSCGEEIKSYQLNIMSEKLFTPSFMKLVNTSTAEDLDCLKMEFQISGVSDGKEAFNLVVAEGSINIDAIISELRSGKTVTLGTLVNGWDSPAQIEPNFTLSSLKLLINGYYSLCHKGKPINVLFLGEEDFTESELQGDTLEVPLIVSTLMPVNASEKNLTRLDKFHQTVDHLTYVLLDHKKDKFSTTPFFCSDSKVSGNIPNRISITPYFIRINESLGYEVTDPMFSSSYEGYFKHDFNFIEREKKDLSTRPFMNLLPTFSHLPYDITYRQGSGDGCEIGSSLKTRINVSKAKRKECHSKKNKMFICSVDWDLKDDGLQNHLCSCEDI